MKTEGSFQCLQEPPGLRIHNQENSVYALTPYLCVDRYNITLQSTPSAHKWCLFFTLSEPEFRMQSSVSYLYYTI